MHLEALRVAVEHHGHVLPRDAGVRGEGRGARAADDAVGERPVDVGRVPRAFRHVTERRGRAVRHVRTGEPGEHGHELRTRHVRGGGEGRSARAADDTGVIQLLDIRVAPARLGHVRERERGAARRGGIGAVDVLHDAAVECARLDEAAVEHAADELDVVKRLHGHDVPDAGLEVNVGIAVVIRPALLAVLCQAGAVAVDGVEGGHGVDHAVVRAPALVDVEAAGGVLVIVFAHVVCAGVEQRPHPGRRDVVAGDRVLHGLVTGIGEVVDIRLDADAVIDLERLVDRQVEEGVVVVRQEVGAEHALQRLEHGLIGVFVDAELLQLEVEQVLELRDAEALGERLGQVRGHVHDRAVGFNEARAVMRRCDLGHGVHPAALAAGEQRARCGAGGLGRCDFLRAAVCHQLEKQARRRAAEAVTDEIYGAARAPAVKERPLVGDAVARVVVRCAVRRAVVDRRAGQLRVELTRAVPCA